MENKVWTKLLDHERRLRALEEKVMEMKGELHFNTALTLTILAAILSLITIVIRGR